MADPIWRSENLKSLNSYENMYMRVFGDADYESDAVRFRKLKTVVAIWRSKIF